MNNFTTFRALVTRFLRSPVIVCCSLLAIFGTVSVFNQPPLAVNDEISHFGRAYDISRGHIFTPSLANGTFGMKVPNGILELGRVATYPIKEKPATYSVKQTVSDAGKVSINQPLKVELGFSNTAQYSPLAYIPQTIGVIIGRSFDLSILASVYLVRILVLITFVATVGLAVWLTPIKKWFIAVIALLPMSIQGASSASIDGLLIASCLLFIAAFLRAYASKSLTIDWRGRAWPVLLPIMCVSATYASLAKPVYFPLFLVVAFLPIAAFVSQRKKWLSVGLTLFIPFVLLTGWNLGLIARHSADAQRAAIAFAGIHPPDTKQGIISLLHPSYTVELLTHTYIDQSGYQHDIPNYITQGFFGSLLSNQITVPVWFSFSVAASLLLAFFRVDRLVLVFRRRLIAVLLAASLICWAGITFSMYFYTTTAGQDFINGIQGRYFIPMLPFLLLLRWRQNPFIQVAGGVRSATLIASLCAANLMFTQWLIFERFWR